jgi:hypothetical protein
MENNKPVEWITVHQAAQAANVSYDTALKWSHAHGIGRKVVGRWQVDRRRLEALLGFGVTVPPPRKRKNAVVRRKGMLP